MGEGIQHKLHDGETGGSVGFVGDQFRDQLWEFESADADYLEVCKQLVIVIRLLL